LCHFKEKKYKQDLTLGKRARIKMKQTTLFEKPVILLNIDSLMPQALEVAAQTGRAPALQFLMENGTYSLFERPPWKI